MLVDPISLDFSLEPLDLEGAITSTLLSAPSLDYKFGSRIFDNQTKTTKNHIKCCCEDSTTETNFTTDEDCCADHHCRHSLRRGKCTKARRRNQQCHKRSVNVQKRHDHVHRRMRREPLIHQANTDEIYDSECDDQAENSNRNFPTEYDEYDDELIRVAKFQDDQSPTSEDDGYAPHEFMVHNVECENSRTMSDTNQLQSQLDRMAEDKPLNLSKCHSSNALISSLIDKSRGSTPRHDLEFGDQGNILNRRSVGTRGFIKNRSTNMSSQQFVPDEDDSFSVPGGVQRYLNEKRLMRSRRSNGDDLMSMRPTSRNPSYDKSCSSYRLKSLNYRDMNEFSNDEKFPKSQSSMWLHGGRMDGTFRDFDSFEDKDLQKLFGSRSNAGTRGDVSPISDSQYNRQLSGHNIHDAIEQQQQTYRRDNSFKDLEFGVRDTDKLHNNEFGAGDSSDKEVKNGSTLPSMLCNFSKALGDIRYIRENRMKRFDDYKWHQQGPTSTNENNRSPSLIRSTSNKQLDQYNNNSHQLKSPSLRNSGYQTSTKPRSKSPKSGRNTKTSIVISRSPSLNIKPKTSRSRSKTKESVINAEEPGSSSSYDSEYRDVRRTHRQLSGRCSRSTSRSRCSSKASHKCRQRFPSAENSKTSTNLAQEAKQERLPVNNSTIALASNAAAAQNRLFLLHKQQQLQLMQNQNQLLRMQLQNQQFNNAVAGNNTGPTGYEGPGPPLTGSQQQPMMRFVQPPTVVGPQTNIPGGSGIQQQYGQQIPVQDTHNQLMRNNTGSMGPQIMPNQQQFVQQPTVIQQPQQMVPSNNQLMENTLGIQQQSQYNQQMMQVPPMNTISGAPTGPSQPYNPLTQPNMLGQTATGGVVHQQVHQHQNLLPGNYPTNVLPATVGMNNPNSSSFNYLNNNRGDNISQVGYNDHLDPTRSNYFNTQFRPSSVDHTSLVMSNLLRQTDTGLQSNSRNSNMYASPNLLNRVDTLDHNNFSRRSVNSNVEDGDHINTILTAAKLLSQQDYGNRNDAVSVLRNRSRLSSSQNNLTNDWDDNMRNKTAAAEILSAAAVNAVKDVSNAGGTNSRCASNHLNMSNNPTNDGKIVAEAVKNLLSDRSLRDHISSSRRAHSPLSASSLHQYHSDVEHQRGSSRSYRYPMSSRRRPAQTTDTASAAEVKAIQRQIRDLQQQQQIQALQTLQLTSKDTGASYIPRIHGRSKSESDPRVSSFRRSRYDYKMNPDPTGFHCDSKTPIRHSQHERSLSYHHQDRPHYGSHSPHAGGGGMIPHHQEKPRHRHYSSNSRQCNRSDYPPVPSVNYLHGATLLGTPDSMSESGGSFRSRAGFNKRTLPYLPHAEDPALLPTERRHKDRMRSYSHVRQSSLDEMLPSSSYDRYPFNRASASDRHRSRASPAVGGVGSNFHVAGRSGGLMEVSSATRAASSTDLRRYEPLTYNSTLGGGGVSRLLAPRSDSSFCFQQGSSNVITGLDYTETRKKNNRDQERRMLETILPSDLKHLAYSGDVSSSSIQKIRQEIENDLSGNKTTGMSNTDQTLLMSEGEAARRKAESRLLFEASQSSSNYDRLRQEMARYSSMRDPRLRAELKLQDRNTSNTNTNFRTASSLSRRNLSDSRLSYSTDRIVSKLYSGGRRSGLSGGLTSGLFPGETERSLVAAGDTHPLSRPSSRSYTNLNDTYDTSRFNKDNSLPTSNMTSNDADTFHREERKNKIKMEIARRRQQIEENASLHEELNRLSRLRDATNNNNSSLVTNATNPLFAQNLEDVYNPLINF